MQTYLLGNCAKIPGLQMDSTILKPAANICDKLSEMRRVTLKVLRRDERDKRFLIKDAEMVA